MPYRLALITTTPDGDTTTQPWGAAHRHTDRALYDKSTLFLLYQQVGYRAEYGDLVAPDGTRVRIDVIHVNA